MSYKGCNTASQPCFAAAGCSALYLKSSNQTSQPFSGGWVRWMSLRMSIRRIHALLQTCFNMSAKVLLDTVFAPYYRHIRVWDRPRWSPSTMSAAALTHCAKIRGSIAKMCKHLRRKRRHRESQTEKLCLQQPRLQSLLPPGKEFQVDLQRRPPRTLSLNQTFTTYL